MPNTTSSTTEWTTTVRMGRRDRYAAGLQVERQCALCTQWRPRNPDTFTYLPSSNRFHTWCKPCAAEYNRTHRSATPRTSARRGAGTARRFGVEIEFVGDPRAVHTAMVAAGINVHMESYNHTTRGYWKIVPDGSVARGAEVVSPVLRGADGMEQVRKVCAALKAAGATVDTSTGLHVHHDARDLTLQGMQTLVQNWQACTAATDGLVAPSRRRTGEAGMRWCKPLSAGVVHMVNQMSQLTRQAFRYFDRYYSLNLHAYSKYGTVEVRQHQGTIEADKILAWVAFGQAHMAAAKAGTAVRAASTAAMLETLLTGGYLSSEMATYLNARAARFARNNRSARVAS